MHPDRIGGTIKGMSGLDDACCQRSRVRRVNDKPNFSWPGTRTKYVYDQAGHLLGEYSGTGTLIQETVWLGDIPVATLRPNGASVAIFYVETDQLNTPRAVIVPSNNAVRWTWYVRPFGNLAPTIDPQNLGNFTYDLRFPGQIAGAWGSTFQNDNRDLDPAVGRYVESDPIGLAGVSYSTYAYAGGNPVSSDDPDGLCPPSEQECEEQAKKDEAVCRSLPNKTLEDKEVRRRCWASVQERFGNCSANRPLGPLITWREATPLVPPPRLDIQPANSYAVPGVALIFLIPWPGNPIYGGL